MSKKKKKHQVPKVLWKVYGNNVRTLMDTILFFLPPPRSTAPECRCGGGRCLGCCSSDADRRSFLLRIGDSADYHELLKKSFAFVSNGTPKIAMYYPEQWLEQEEIVRNTIDLMNNSRSSSNVICCGYDKPIGLNSILYDLSTSAWRLLLTRIGDDAMAHLLRFSSIFLALPSKNHHQVTGPPMNNFLQFSNFSKHKTLVSQLGSENQQPLVGQSGSRKKRRVDIAGAQKFDAMISEQQSSGSLRFDSSVCPVTSEDNKHRKRVRPFSWQRRRKRRQLNLPEDNVLYTLKMTSNDNNNLNGKLQQCLSTYLRYSSGISVKPGTCVLPTQSCVPGRAEINELKQEIFSDKNNMRIPSVSLEGTPKVHSVKSSSDSTVSITQMEVLSSQDLVRVESEKHHIPQVPYEKMRSQCFYCLMLQAPQKVRRGDQISRQYMFYNSRFSYSLFPRNRILFSMIPHRLRVYIELSYECHQVRIQYAQIKVNVSGNPKHICKHGSKSWFTDTYRPSSIPRCYVSGIDDTFNVSAIQWKYLYVLGMYRRYPIYHLSVGFETDTYRYRPIF